jgi:hypothetical protein
MVVKAQVRKQERRNEPAMWFMKILYNLMLKKIQFDLDIIDNFLIG